MFDLTDTNNDSNIWGVVMNGKIIGGVVDRKKFIKEFKNLRKNNFINKYVSLFEDERDRLIEIWTDAGRLVRPLINYQEFCLSQQQFI